MEYLEVCGPEGTAHEVDPDIPAWGTSRGSIEEYESRDLLLQRVRELIESDYDICLDLKREAMGI